MLSARLVVAVVMSAVQCVVAPCPLEARSDWGALPPQVPPLNVKLPVPYVVIHHSYIPAACATREACLKAMKSMQHFHQAVKGWNDIGYNFAIGSDGSVYEGRGWDIVGAHAPQYNSKSVGICFIGDYRTELPPPSMLQAAQQLIVCGVEQGSIHANYTVVGHSQVRATECPGDALFQEIQGWSHWKPIRDIQTPAPLTRRVAEPDNNTTLANSADNNTTLPNRADSNTTLPNSADSNSALPNSADSNTTLLNSADSSSTAVPDSTDSNTTLPNSADSNTALPNSADSNTTLLNSADSSSTAVPNSADSNTTLPNSADSNTTLPNSADSNTTQPNSADSISTTVPDSTGRPSNIDVPMTDSNNAVPNVTDSN